jgi:hypothetical protein
LTQLRARLVHQSEYLALMGILIGTALWQRDQITGGNPWPLLGWLLHISVDRLVGFGLRGDDGGQALI